MVVKNVTNTNGRFYPDFATCDRNFTADANRLSCWMYNAIQHLHGIMPTWHYLLYKTKISYGFVKNMFERLMQFHELCWPGGCTGGTSKLIYFLLYNTWIYAGTRYLHILLVPYHHDMQTFKTVNPTSPTCPGMKHAWTDRIRRNYGGFGVN